MKKIFLSIALLTVAFASAENFRVQNENYSLNYIMNVNSFCKLIQMGDYETVKTLIADGVDINEKSAGLTPLMFAARHNKVKIAKLLIANGAKLNTKSDRKGFTALKWAEISNAKEAYVVIENALMEKKAKKKQRRFS
ncbi:ankyrin repeat domain-containing protein [Lutibacter flavus]|uniref:Ankyrin repeat-containing protein n=1 Tax=Lutibacter flavus TaxID=691689 RepID=A0A238YA50_9FLAO|nr:ankyrin repeat domain-containing protein [Lutibacter flavus]SNR67832.1 Ankyrin repeat-containing protein [Lutibacter flavus]